MYTWFSPVTLLRVLPSVPVTDASATTSGRLQVFRCESFGKPGEVRGFHTSSEHVPGDAGMEHSYSPAPLTPRHTFHTPCGFHIHFKGTNVYHIEEKGGDNVLASRSRALASCARL